MKVSVPKETFPGERRVALVPASVVPLNKAGVEVTVESGAGAAAGILDQQYVDRGARITSGRAALFDADVVLQVRTYSANQERGHADLQALKPGSVLIGLCDPLGEPAAVRELATREIRLFALEMIPRITRAQVMDVLSSQATIAGYRAVLMGAMEMPRIMPMLMTAAGTLAAARTFVIGAGVAGLQAIATARRLGAIVQAYDVRPATREQVESLGGKFVQLELSSEEAEDRGGYAKAMGESFYARQRELMASVVADCDLVVTTAAIPGQPSPRLITAEAVAGMKPGSVIVDLAAQRGGNCELSRPNERVVENGVVILGPTNLPAEVPFHASQMFSNNVTKFLLNMVHEGQLRLDAEDEIIRDTLLCAEGRVTHPRLCELLGIQPPDPPPAAEGTDDERGSA